MFVLLWAPAVGYWTVLHVGSANFDDVLQCQSPKPHRPSVATCPSTGRSPPGPVVLDVSFSGISMYDSHTFANLPDGFDGGRTCGELLDVPFRS